MVRLRASIVLGVLLLSLLMTRAEQYTRLFPDGPLPLLLALRSLLEGPAVR